MIQKLDSFQFFLKPRKIVAQYKLFFGDEWLEASVDSIAPYVHKILFVVSEVAWGDDLEDPKIKGDDLEHILEKLKKKYPNKLIVYKGKWNAQIPHVRAGLHFIKENIPEATHCLYIDSDEIYTKELIIKLIRLTRSIKYFQKASRISYFTYFKTIYNKIAPIKYPNHLVIFPITEWIDYTDARNVNAATIDFNNLYYEHPAYVRKDDEKMRLKIEAHRETEPIIGDWYHEVWLKWTPLMKNFHPTHPELWESTVPVNTSELPEAMVRSYENWQLTIQDHDHQ
jgi:hypothetical protein